MEDMSLQFLVKEFGGEGTMGAVIIYFIRTSSVHLKNLAVNIKELTHVVANLKTADAITKTRVDQLEDDVGRLKDKVFHK